MRIFQNIKSFIMQLFPALRKRHAKPRVKPENLSPGVMAKVLEETRFLQERHGVEVRPLASGEIPSPPKRASQEQ